MTIKQLGDIRAPLFLFGGPYGNLEATRAALDEAARLGIPPERTLCTGDITAYCGNPGETAALVKASGIHVIQGNCEENLAADGEDCGCGYDGDTACAALSVAWYDFSRRHTPTLLKQWMGVLPMRIEFTLSGRRVHVLHGAADSINRFIFPSTARADKAAEIATVGADIVIAGHSGLPFTEVIDGRVWHNPGVIGLPANDGTPRVWYSLITLHDGAPCFEHRSLAYDHEKAAATMRANGLGAYAETLITGIYPTLDSLPETEKAQTGKPLRKQALSLSQSLERT